MLRARVDALLTAGAVPGSYVPEASLARTVLAEEASELAIMLPRERAPLATPDARWDRLLYPIQDVESYLKARLPRDLLPASASRLPRTDT